MKRTLIGSVVVVVALGLTSCSAAPSGPSAAASTAPTPASSTPAPAGSTPAPAGSASGTGTGSAGCAALTKADVAKYALYVQVLPQVRRQSSLTAVRKEVVSDYTPAKLSAILAKLEFLRGNGVPGLGDPGPALDYYAQVNAALATLLAQSDPVPQSAIDTYVAVVGPVGQSIGKQVAINAALSELCTNLT